MQSVIGQLIQDIAERKKLRREALSKMVSNDKKCPVCIHVTEFTEMYSEKTVELLASSDEFSKLFQKSKGLCISHFVALVCVAESMKTNKSRDILEMLSEKLPSVSWRKVKILRKAGFKVVIRKAVTYF